MWCTFCMCSITHYLLPVNSAYQPSISTSYTFCGEPEQLHLGPCSCYTVVLFVEYSIPWPAFHIFVLTVNFWSEPKSVPPSPTTTIMQPEFPSFVLTFIESYCILYIQSLQSLTISISFLKICKSQSTLHFSTTACLSTYSNVSQRPRFTDGSLILKASWVLAIKHLVNTWSILIMVTYAFPKIHLKTRLWHWTNLSHYCNKLCCCCW